MLAGILFYSRRLPVAGRIPVALPATLGGSFFAHLSVLVAGDSAGRVEFFAFGLISVREFIALGYQQHPVSLAM